MQRMVSLGMRACRRSERVAARVLLARCPCRAETARGAAEFCSLFAIIDVVGSAADASPIAAATCAVRAVLCQ